MVAYYIETSALVKRYRTESGSAVIKELFTHLRQEEALTTSHFTSLEVEAAAARALKARTMTTEAYGMMLWSYAQDMERWFTLLPVSSTLITEAADVTKAYALRAADAVHLATALRLQRGLSVRLVFVTSDLELITACHSAGMSVLNPVAENSHEELAQWRSS